MLEVGGFPRLFQIVYFRQRKFQEHRSERGLSSGILVQLHTNHFLQ